LKNCTAFSWRFAAVRLENVPKLRRLPVFGFFFREYRRYRPLFNLSIMALALRNPEAARTAMLRAEGGA